MKKLIGIAVIFASLSIAYYFTIFLPKLEIQKAKFQAFNQAKSPEENSKFNLENQEKCAQMAKKFFEQEGYANNDRASYECHYNKKLNKFFILVKSMIINAPQINCFETLSDIAEHKIYGEYFWFNPGGKKFWEIVPTWKILGAPGEGQAGWDSFVKQYMED